MKRQSTSGARNVPNHSIATCLARLILLAVLIFSSSPVLAQLVEQPALPPTLALRLRPLSGLPRPFERTSTPSIFQSTAPAGFTLFEALFADQSRRFTSPRLAGVPNMFGDFSFSGIHMSQGAFPFSTADAPLAGGSRGFKLAENGGALPRDRIYYAYHHFHNAVEVNTVGITTSMNTISVDRQTLGFERTFHNGWSSIDVRMHVTGGADFSDPIVRVQTGNVGDLAMSFKRLLYEDDYSAYSTGFGLTLPTGSDLDVLAPLDSAGFRVHNDAVHVSPFLAAVCHPNDLYFYQAVAQIDVPVNGNRVEGMGMVGEVLGPVMESGILTEQPILFLDLSAGIWLWQDPDADWHRGVAAVVEYHYTSTMGNADFVPLSMVPGAPALSSNSFDMSNLTLGLHLQLTHGTNVRVGGAFPLENYQAASIFSDDDRLFDAEFHVQINRQY